MSSAKMSVHALHSLARGLAELVAEDPLADGGRLDSRTIDEHDEPSSQEGCGC